MPVRKIPLVTREYYHIFNRGLNHQKTLTTAQDYISAMKVLLCYQSIDNHPKYYSIKFWNRVKVVLSDYKKSRTWLKEKSHSLLV